MKEPTDPAVLVLNEAIKHAVNNPPMRHLNPQSEAFSEYLVDYVRKRGFTFDVDNTMLSPMQQGAIETHEMCNRFEEAGFNRKEAFDLTMTAFSINLAAGASKR